MIRHRPSTRRPGSGFRGLLPFLVGLALAAPAGADDAMTSPREELAAEAQKLLPLAATDVARSFLAAVPDLPAVAAPRVLWYRRDTRDALTPEEAAARTEAELEGFEQTELDERFYWFTRYGTPLAFARPLELLGEAGLATADGLRLLDFGFGSIGQLRLLASLGADVTGIEVDPLLERLYAQPGDTGAIPRAASAGPGPEGSLRLLFGHFPAEETIVRDAGTGYDAFVSKNTLKRGYIHPAEEVDPRMLVDLGVDDAAFVAAVHALLNPGGFFLIYNLCPAPSKERYIPWSDGRSPFDGKLLEAAGFEVLAFDRDDTEAARAMGEALGWAGQMDLQTDLFGTYTLARKR